MKIALISPNWEDQNPYPPLGLAYLGAVLEKAGLTVNIFDLTLEHDKPFEKMLEEIVISSPDIIGLSAMSHNYVNALEIAKFLKKNTNATIVFGGPHPTIMPEEVLQNEFIDFVVLGEGEETFLKMCQCLQVKKFDGIDGLCYKNNGKIVIQPKKHFIKDLDKLPFPARHLLKLDSYTLLDDYGNRMVTLISSRGCPFGCTFCYKGLFGRTYRQRSAENIIKEIKTIIEKFNYKSFYFIDDLFTLNLKRVEELTLAIKKEDLNIRWQCLARVNNATLQMFKLMKESGCYKVHFGIESGNQQILNRVKKEITLEQVRQAVLYCKEAGIKTKGYFMLGLPGDTVKTMQDTINFANELELDEVMFSITTPFPGTQLWESIDKNKIKSLSSAFYYFDNFRESNDINIFYNLSEVTDSKLIKIVKSAQHMEKRNHYIKKFGKSKGIIIWQISKTPIINKIGKNILSIMRNL